MKANVKATDVFKAYFCGKIDENTYKDLSESLSKVESMAEGSNKPLDHNNKILKDFVEKFYTIKNSFKESYTRIKENANSIEKQLRPMKVKVWENLRLKQLVKLYSNCNKFEELMILKHGIYMAGIGQKLQQEKNGKEAKEL